MLNTKLDQPQYMKQLELKKTTSMLGYAGEVCGWSIPMKFGILIGTPDVMMCAKCHRPRSLPFGIIVVQS